VDGILASLDELGWVARRNIRVVAANWIDCAYVHFTTARERALPKIREALAGFDIHAVGRYGQWDHMSMEDSIYSGMETAGRLLGSAGR
jgi:protoporphyrinogen oxidase